MLLLLIWCSRTQLYALVLLMVGEPTFVLAAHSALLVLLLRSFA
ncbi:unnamed protein product, partial [Musa hybrid cultivar]